MLDSLDRETQENDTIRLRVNGRVRGSECRLIGHHSNVGEPAENTKRGKMRLKTAMLLGAFK